MSANEPAYHLGTRNHLFITESSLVCGTVEPCPGRLSDLLRSLLRPSLAVKDAEITFFGDGSTASCDLIHVYLNSVILSHEYVALGGDEHQRALWDNARPMDAQVNLGSVPGLTLRGRIATDALEREERFLAVMSPIVEGGPDQFGHVLELVDGLPYLLVNRSKIDCVMVLDDSGGDTDTKP
jgi:hypothetical protein